MRVEELAIESAILGLDVSHVFVLSQKTNFLETLATRYWNARIAD